MQSSTTRTILAIAVCAAADAAAIGFNSNDVHMLSAAFGPSGYALGGKASIDPVVLAAAASKSLTPPPVLQSPVAQAPINLESAPVMPTTEVPASKPTPVVAPRLLDPPKGLVETAPMNSGLLVPPSPAAPATEVLKDVPQALPAKAPVAIAPTLSHQAPPVTAIAKQSDPAFEQKPRGQIPDGMPAAPVPSVTSADKAVNEIKTDSASLAFTAEKQSAVASLPVAALPAPVMWSVPPQAKLIDILKSWGREADWTVEVDEVALPNIAIDVTPPASSATFLEAASALFAAVPQSYPAKVVAYASQKTLVVTYKSVPVPLAKGFVTVSDTNTWSFSPNNKLKDVLTRWTSASDWSMVWDADAQDVVLQSEASFRGEFSSAIESLAQMVNVGMAVRIKADTKLKSVRVTAVKSIATPKKKDLVPKNDA